MRVVEECFLAKIEFDVVFGEIDREEIDGLRKRIVQTGYLVIVLAVFHAHVDPQAGVGKQTTSNTMIVVLLVIEYQTLCHS